MSKITSSLFVKYMIIFVTILLITSAIIPYIVMMFYEYIPEFPLELLTREESLHKAILVRTGVFSIIAGVIFISIGTRVILKPINLLSEAAKKVATGDFSIRVEEYEQHDAISELINSFNIMVNQLSKNENLHKDFVSNVSHEFKTPISSIAGYAELLKTPNLSEEKRMEYAEIIINHTSRLTKLSSNLLKLSELENQTIGLNKSVFSLDEQIRDGILLLQREWEEKQITLEIELEEVNYFGQKELMYQVWVNIIENAIKFTKEHGTIFIKMEKQEEIVVTIQDTGIGMKEDEVEKVFDRFYKVDSSRSTKGTGLGLSIVKKIIELHQGRIQLESKVNIGTKFTIYLANEGSKKEVNL